MKKVSIIIPCYNDPENIIQAVTSAINQSYSNKEVIVVDDGSNESTKEVLRALETDIDLLITQENKGSSAARNIGIKSANGELIIVLDSDDFFDENFCKEAVCLFDENPHNKIVTCQARRFNSKGTLDIFTPPGGDLKNFLFFNSALGNSLFSMKAWEEVGGYDETMTQGFEDWEFFIRVLRTGGKAAVIKKPLFNYRQRRNSLTHRANKKRPELLKYILLKHRDLYIDQYSGLVTFLLGDLKMAIREKEKLSESMDYRIGRFFLNPFRVIRDYFL